jgi:hypothetical protein
MSRNTGSEEKKPKKLIKNIEFNVYKIKWEPSRGTSKTAIVIAETERIALTLLIERSGCFYANYVIHSIDLVPMERHIVGSSYF